MSVDVSVIVLTHNRPQRCADSLRHNAACMKGLRAEFIVVNNGPMPVPLPGMLDGIPCRILQMPSNLGAEARNEGLRAAQGAFILTLDDDSYIDPGLVEAMLEIFKADAQTGAVSLRIECNGAEESCLLPTIFHGCACGFRKIALERVGGYPKGYLYYGEEYDLAFRLYQAGYNLALCNETRKVRHVRDTGGRNTGNIIRLLLRNNTVLWFRFFPWRAIPAAMRDTLQRYACVARKENAEQGYLEGRRAVPGAALRGMRTRSGMSRALFEKVTLAGPVARLGAKMRAQGVRQVVVCGVGKFPSLWASGLRRQGLRVRSFWDFNACWEGQRIAGIPVAVVRDALPPVPEDCQYVVGTTSLADNTRWQMSLIRAGITAADARWVALPGEGSADRGSFDLSRICRIHQFKTENSGKFRLLRPMASALLSPLTME